MKALLERTQENRALGPAGPTRSLSGICFQEKRQGEPVPGAAFLGFCAAQEHRGSLKTTLGEEARGEQASMGLLHKPCGSQDGEHPTACRSAGGSDSAMEVHFQSTWWLHDRSSEES